MKNLILLDMSSIGEQVIGTKFDDWFIPEIFWGIIICLVLSLFALVSYFVIKHAMKDPLKRPKGLMLVLYILVEKAEGLVVEIMGEKNKGFTGYILALMGFIFISFVFGITGISSPLTYFGIPLLLALITLVLIHAQAVKTNKWRYFHRYIEPLPFFLPINLITMWAPMLSMSLRLFGNAMAGYCLMSVIYFGSEYLSTMLFGAGAVLNTASDLTAAGIVFAPIMTPVLHAYFDLFSGFIQTLVFAMLTMINIYQEQGEDDPTEIIDRVQVQ